jgi:glycosyltransferase involved in cell wall biosynthesis
MQEFHLTVAICTHNRSSDLADCLNSLCFQNLSDIQLLVVDSASAIDEKQAIEDLSRRYSKVQLIRLNEPGLSKARNAAFAAARAPWIAYLDDDTIPCPTWAIAALNLISNVPPDCAAIGGRTTALLPSGGAPPIGRRWQQLLSIVDIPGEGDQTTCPRIVGANILLRTDILRDLGGFSLELGRVGTSFLSGEEKLLIERIVAAGNRLWYSDRLLVEHRIDRARFSRAWAERRAYWDGVSDQRIEILLGRRLSVIRLLKIAIATPILALLYPVRGKQEFFIRFWYNVGWLRAFAFRSGIPPVL